MSFAVRVSVPCMALGFLVSLPLGNGGKRRQCPFRHRCVFVGTISSSTSSRPVHPGHLLCNHIVNGNHHVGMKCVKFKDTLNVNPFCMAPKEPMAPIRTNQCVY